MDNEILEECKNRRWFAGATAVIIIIKDNMYTPSSQINLLSVDCTVQTSVIQKLFWFAMHLAPMQLNLYSPQPLCQLRMYTVRVMLQNIKGKKVLYYTSHIQRITNAGGMIVNGRVQGILAVTRAFGDEPLKRITKGYKLYTCQSVYN